MTSLLEAQKLAHTFRKPQVVQNDRSQGLDSGDQPEMEIQKQAEISLLWALADKLRSYTERQGVPLKERNEQARIFRENPLTEVCWTD